MAARTRTGAQTSAREANGLPQSMAALRLMVVQAIKLSRKLESTCYIEQHVRQHEDDEIYGSPDPGGERLSYADYRAAMREREKRLKDSVPPAVWRAAMKRAEEELEAE